MSNTDIQPSYLIIDWGTTNFRAFAMSEAGDLLAKKELGMGLLQVEAGQFAKALETVLAEWLSDYKSLPIYMAGMVGSLQGWVNVPYAAAPLSNGQLIDQAHQFDLPWGASATIIPGVSYQVSDSVYDVMRGEEVQLFGLAKLVEQTDFIAVMPGTHSKHVKFEQAKLTEFSTYMTGELFSVISKQTILGKGLPEQSKSAPADAFYQGVTESQLDNFTNVLFHARTHRVFGTIAETEIYDFLSGLLIGYELKNLKNQTIYLVGGESLCQRYVLVCEQFGIQAKIVNGDDCFLAGMSGLIKELNNVN
ncbi:2-dehydro-3-deoxygalactonokinase [Catenovulum maritimum]|uniref:2-dehydro-3-deoxygalactonokinase n=1 Tax=Catenovulum maritimum TaxID=1513271 RepID=UPI00065FBB0E|nr:2-dehydro-3-deoxygalactonokinase [Catenovulum maritimum]